MHSIGLRIYTTDGTHHHLLLRIIGLWNSLESSAEDAGERFRRVAYLIPSGVVAAGGRHEVRRRMDSRCDHLGADDAVRLLRLVPYYRHVEVKEELPYGAQVRETNGVCIGGDQFSFGDPRSVCINVPRIVANPRGSPHCEYYYGTGGAQQPDCLALGRAFWVVRSSFLNPSAVQTNRAASDPKRIPPKTIRYAKFSAVSHHQRGPKSDFYLVGTEQYTCFDECS